VQCGEPRPRFDRQLVERQMARPESERAVERPRPDCRRRRAVRNQVEADARNAALSTALPNPAAECLAA
jgi:hypothetical protein